MKAGGALHIILVVLAVANMLPALEAEASWGQLAVILVCAVSSVVYLRATKGRPLPSLAVNAGVLAALGFLLWEMFGAHEDPTVHILDLAHFVAFLACCKFFECVTFRDAGLIAIICFLLMAISALVSASPLFAAVLLADVTVGVGWLLRFHAIREQFAIESRMRALAGLEPGAPSDPPPARMARYPRALVGCSLTLAVVAVVIFISVPRGVYGGVFGRMHGLVPTSVTGLGDVVALDDATIYEDPTPVMKVRLSIAGRPVRDPSFQAYLRGQTFERYFRGKWRRTPMARPRTIPPMPAGSPTVLLDAPNFPMPADLLKQEIWLDSSTTGVLFAVYPPIAIEAAGSRLLRMDRKNRVLQAEVANDISRYTVYSPVRIDGDMADALHAGAREPKGSSSEVPARIARFAESLVEPIGDPADESHHARMAAAIEEYLASDEFEYTLHRGSRSLRRSRRDPVVDFLFDNRRGHCEYFASAMTLMCQSLGIRARLVQGYLGGEYNEAGEFYRVRQKDAHAWVEVHLSDRGWTVFDPTPSAARSPEGLDDSLSARLQRVMDYIYFSWSNWVVSFDRETRQDLAAGFKAWMSVMVENVEEPHSFGGLFMSIVYGPETLEWWQRVLYWVILLLIGLLIVAVVRVLWILWRLVSELITARRASTRRGIRRPEAAFYDRLILALANRGYVKPAHLTPREFAAALGSRHGDLRDVGHFTEWFYEVQYGGAPLPEARWQRLKAYLRRLREDPNFAAAPAQHAPSHDA